MEKLVILNVNSHSEENEFLVFVQIYNERDTELGRATGYLPSCSEIFQKLETWKISLDRFTRFKETVNQQKVVIKNQPLRERVEHKIHTRSDEYENQKNNYQMSEVDLKQSFNRWLDAESFKPILKKLDEEISTSDLVRVIIYTPNLSIQMLPWESWNWLSFPNRQGSISFTTSLKPLQPILRTQIKIGIIIGNLSHVAAQKELIEKIEQLFNNLPNIEILPILSNPTLENINQFLKKEALDILYFTSHGKTHNGITRLYINEHEYLEVEHLENAFKKLIKNGLKLAIFDTCDCLLLANEISDKGLFIPNLVVMRDIIHYQASKKFLQQLIDLFIKQKQLLHLAFNEARNSLKALNEQFPGFPLMPVLFCATKEPQLWENWLKRANIYSWHNLQKGIAASVLMTTLLMGVRLLGILQGLEWKVFDLMMWTTLQIRSSEGRDDRLLIVEVTEKDIDALGVEHPLPHQIIVQALKNLEQHKPLAIGLDIIQSQPIEKRKSPLIQYLSQSFRTVAVCSPPNLGNEGHPLPEGISKDRAASMDVVVDSDGIVRRHLLAATPPDGSLCPVHYTLSTELALRYLEAKGYKLEISKGQGNYWMFQEQNKIKQSFEVLTRHIGFYPQITHTSGYQILLNYRSYQSLNDFVKRITLTEVIKNPDSLNFINGRILLIGVTDPTLAKDEFRTPYNQEIRGLLLHAQMTSQIISAVENQRPLFKFLPLWGDILLITVFSLLEFIFIWHLQLYLNLRLNGVIVLALLVTACLLMLKTGLLLPIVPLILTLTIPSSIKIMQTAINNQSTDRSF